MRDYGANLGKSAINDRKTLKFIIDKLFYENNEGLSYEEFTKVCQAPFIHANAAMQEDSYPEVTIMHIAKLHPRYKKIQEVVKSLKGMQEREPSDVAEARIESLTETINKLKTRYNKH